MTLSDEKDMMYQTLRLVLLEATDAYRALSEDDIASALQHLKNLAKHADNMTSTSNVTPSEETEQDKRASYFASPTPVRGCDTILSFALRNDIYYWQEDDDALIRYSLTDSRTVMKLMKDRGLTATKVEAPQVLKDRGIETINCYPEDILSAVLVG